MEQLFGLQIGEKIELRKADSTRKYNSSIQDILKENSFQVLMPSQRGQVILIHANEIVEVIFYRNDGVYSFIATATRSFKQNHVYLLELISSANSLKQQRRSYFRLNIILPAQFRILPEMESQDKITPVKLESGYVLNISGGGIYLSTSLPLEKDSMIECRVILQNQKEMVVKGKVIRVIEVFKHEKMYEAVMEFVDLDDQMRERIIQFIFKEQQKIMRKENL